MVSVETVSIVIAAVSVVIGVINSIMSNRKADQQRQTEIDTRQAELFMQLYNRYITREFRAAIIELQSWSWESYDDYMDKYGPLTNPEATTLHITTENVFEGIGVLVQRGLIDKTLVIDLVWFALGNYWERFGPIWKEMRIRMGHPNLADHTEYLYNAIMQVLTPGATFEYPIKTN